MKAAVVTAIVELVLKYGPEAATKLVMGLNIQDPTSTQIRALKVKNPESYFDYPDGDTLPEIMGDAKKE